MLRNTGLYILLILILFSCQKDKCFYGTGEQGSLILSEDYFHTLEISGMFDIELVQDSVYFIEAFGGKNVIEKTEVEIKQDSAFLYNYNSCFWMRDYKRPLLKIHFPEMKHINVYEACYIYSLDTLTDDFGMYVRGRLAEVDLLLNNSNFYFVPYQRTGGTYVFRGKTKRLYLSSYYNAVCDASELKVQDAHVLNKSIADCKVHVDSTLKYEIYSRGNILLKGSPQVLFDSVTSTGILIYQD